jgi:hypothetical protein
LTAYDAAYLNLARRDRLPLATLDKRLRTAATRAGIPVMSWGEVLRAGVLTEAVHEDGRCEQDGEEQYVKDENPALRAVVAGLKKRVKELVPGTKETVNAWGVPTFVGKSPFALYVVGKKHLTFGFPFATSLPDPEGLLEGAGKNMRHVKFAQRGGFGEEGIARADRCRIAIRGRSADAGNGRGRCAWHRKHCLLA